MPHLEIQQIPDSPRNPLVNSVFNGSMQEFTSFLCKGILSAYFSGNSKFCTDLFFRRVAV